MINNSKFAKKNNIYQKSDISERINRVVSFYENSELSGKLSLYSGDSGIVLFFAQLYLRTRNEMYLSKINVIFDELVYILNTRSDIDMSFCNGLAGYAWLVCYLKKHDLIHVDESYLEELDLVLFNGMQTYIHSSRFDQLHEAVGIGRYFLAREQKEYLRVLVNALYTTKDESNSEIKWLSYINGNDKPRYDMGLAHGMIGILYFLTKCRLLCVETCKCDILIDGIFKFYKNNEQDFQKYNTFFAYSYDVVEYNENNIEASNCRYAWCYGDLGVLYVLYLSGKYLNKEDLLKYATYRIQLLVKSKNVENSLVSDSSLCHGSSIIGYIYNKLNTMMDDSNFTESIDYWFNMTLNFEDKIPNSEINMSLLEGQVGSSLFLMSLINNDYMDWDECMMLS